MSARSVLWAEEQDLPPGEKLTLIVLADQARDDGLLADPGQAALASRTGAREPTVRKHFGALENAKLMCRYEGGAGRPDWLKLAVDGTLDLPAPAGTAAAAKRRARGVADLAETIDGAIAALPGAGWDELIPEGVRVDGAALLAQKKKAGGRQVTLEELVVAMAALSAFNRESGKDFGLGAHIDRMVHRIRERPSYDASAHVRLVQSAFRVKWWTKTGRRRDDKPTPHVIYGNSEVFERVVQDAADEKAAGGAPRRRFERQAPSRRRGE